MSAENHSEVNKFDIAFSHSYKKESYGRDVSNKEFGDRCNLKRHLRTHTYGKPYVCEVCNKTFAHSDILKSHLLAHSGKGLYARDFCGKAFTQRSNLKTHLHVHAK
ncbi:hypothetical protein AVEN_10141-1 [Araneus ventricosus]|uniref:C2H2-type domain-containing protein n=1 Tax=Araneus ventricosus TaxID=182803 RepID=A0A4Y2JYV9_ARAVE|nr:hypothetical protein AVEN_10141-1 [Araneus ventricosus]